MEMLDPPSQLIWCPLAGFVSNSYPWRGDHLIALFVRRSLAERLSQSASRFYRRAQRGTRHKPQPAASRSLHSGRSSKLRSARLPRSALLNLDQLRRELLLRVAERLDQQH